MRRALFLEAVGEAWLCNIFVRAIVCVVALAVLVLAVPLAFGQVPDQASTYKREYVRIVHSEWGLDAPIAALAAQIHQESGWDCRAISAAGARGCAQFMPATARWIGELDHDLADGEVHSPAWAFRAQAVYMRWLHDRVKGSGACERLAYAMQAYNSGLGWVLRRQTLSPVPGCCLRATCRINPGVSPASQQEAEGYPLRILRTITPRYVDAGWGDSPCRG